MQRGSPSLASPKAAQDIKVASGTTISVVMPAFNEAQAILTNIQRAAAFLEDFASSYEVVVVDDGSSDATHYEALMSASANARVKVNRLPRNQGKGFALKYGFLFTTGDLIAFLDADLDLGPEQLAVLYKVMQDTGADVVIGSKRHPQSHLDYPWHRRILSTGYYLFVRVLFGLPVKDTQTGIKLFRRQVLEQVFPKILIKRYAFDLELLVNAHRLGFRIAEAPIFLDFTRRFGRIGLRDIWHMGLDTLAVFYRLRIVRYYSRWELK